MRQAKKKRNLLNGLMAFESSSEDFKNKTWFKIFLQFILFVIFLISCHILLLIML